MIKIAIGAPTPISICNVSVVSCATDVVVTDILPLLRRGNLYDKLAPDAYAAIDCVLRDVKGSSDQNWVKNNKLQAIKLIRDLAQIGGGNLGLRESKRMVDEAIAGNWRTELKDAEVHLYD